MLKNYLLTAWRFFKKKFFYNTINIIGLSIAIAACFIIILYIEHEKSYDSFLKNSDKIYSIYSRIKLGADTIEFPLMNYSTAEIVARKIPLVKDYVRTNKPFKDVVLQNLDRLQARFSENNFIFVDSNFFSFFSFGLNRGNRTDVFKNPFSIVITQDAAKKYFGNNDPVGKLLKYDSAYSFIITGIAENPPSNSTFKFDFVASLSSLHSMNEGAIIKTQHGISYGNFQTYFLLSSREKASTFQSLVRNLSIADEQNQGLKIVPYVLSLQDIHLHTSFGSDATTKYLKIFSLIAGLILLLALVNYISLTSLSITLRAKEIGLRKAIGAVNNRIILQFFIESFIYLTVASIIGIFLLLATKPFVFGLLQIQIDTDYIYNSHLLVIFTSIFIFICIFSSAIPAFLFSYYKTANILNGRFKNVTGLFFRKFSFVFQFAIAICIIIMSIIINRQIYYIQHSDTGIKRNNVLIVPFSNTIRGNYFVVKQEINNLPEVENIATSRFGLYQKLLTFSTVNKKTGSDVTLASFPVDKNFIPLLNLEWKKAPQDSLFNADEIILNETAISELGLDINPIGQIIEVGGDPYKIKGILKNFNYTTLASQIDAAGFFIKPDSVNQWGNKKEGCLLIKFYPIVNTSVLIKEIQSIYEKYDKSTPFSFSFLEDSYNAMYLAEKKLSIIIYGFTIITMSICFLGLFALASFSANQRIKEIGIRKILGASVSNIIYILTKGFSILVLVASLIAIPVGYFVAKKWLQNFAFHVSLSSCVFIFAFFSTFIFVITITAIFSIKAARINPVKNLRVE